MAKKKPAYTEDDLRDAIQDMNKILKPEPILDCDDDMDMEDLVESFKEGAEMTHPNDKLDKKTRELAEKLEVEFPEIEEEEKELEEKEEKAEKKPAKKDKKKAPAKKDKKETKKDTKKKDAPKKEKKESVKDNYGFRPGCKKSQVMALIKKGKSTMEDLKEEFGGQVAWAIKEAEERTGTKIKITQKSKCVQIDKS